MRLLVCFFLLLFLAPPTAFAITIDSFLPEQTVTAHAGLGISASTASTSGSLGGTRSIKTEAFGLFGTLQVAVPSVSPTRLQYSQDVGVSGYADIHWDGEGNPFTLNPAGLGGISLLEDSAEGFILSALSYDFPAAFSLPITITVYDASDPSGDTRSFATIFLERSYAGEDVYIPFADFVFAGPNGPADFNNVGALRLFIDGSEPAVDLQIGSLITDGTCDLIPLPYQSALDDCGECIPLQSPLYNQSCSDCLGEPFGTALPGTACETGELGECSAGTYNQQCSCQRINSPVVEMCDGLDNNCNGEIDEIFPQLGLPCGGGVGECAIEGIYVCASNGGIKCEAEFDPLLFSQCGIEIGCDGIPSSGLSPDRCGICGGDGTSCPADCNNIDISSIQFELDAGAKRQELLIRRITTRILRNTRRPRHRTFVAETRKLARERQVRNWVLSWQLPSIQVSCPFSDFCVSTSNASILNEYRETSALLRAQGIRAIRVLRQITRTTYPRLSRRVRQQHRQNLKFSEQVPESYSTCTTPL